MKIENLRHATIIAFIIIPIEPDIFFNDSYSERKQKHSEKDHAMRG